MRFSLSITLSVALWAAASNCAPAPATKVRRGSLTFVPEPTPGGCSECNVEVNTDGEGICDSVGYPNSAYDFYAGVLGEFNYNVLMGAYHAPSDVAYQSTTGYSYPGNGACSLYDDSASQCTNSPESSAYDSVIDTTVYTEYDCLLDQTVQRYWSGDWTDGTGTYVTHYTYGSFDVYRWYDSNNFVWFAQCPTAGRDETDGDPLKRRAPVSQPGKAIRTERRAPWFQKSEASLFERGGGQVFSCPLWDARAPNDRAWNADATPLSNYYFNNINSNGFETFFYSMWWNPYWVSYQGVDCYEMAASRPGLQHWTVTISY